MHSLRLVFMGSPDFAIPSLEKLHGSNHEILKVISNPDKRRRRGRSAEPTPVKKRAIELGLSTMDAEDVNSADFLTDLKKMNPDLLVVVAFRILPPAVLEIPVIGSVNLHASLLPKYRGAAPVHWSVIKGENETGCTVFFLNEKVDTGEIIAQNRVKIGAFETAGDIYNRLKETGSDLLLRSVNQIADGSVTPTPQNDGLATPAPRLFKENTRIDFTRTASEVHNFIRGLSPFPTAWCIYSGKKMNIYRSKPAEQQHLQPGELSFEDEKLIVGCGDRSIELLSLQLPGTRKMNGRDFANGYSLDVYLK